MLKLDKIIGEIKDAGFGYLKVELEGHLSRGDGDQEYEDCRDCDGRGLHDHEDCDGGGVITQEAYSSSGRALGVEVEVECYDCNGEGVITCNECSGEGEVYAERSNYSSVSACESFIMDYVSTEAKNSLNYHSFYYDGSVDSEMTFTLPVEKAEYVIEFINAFSALADEIGNGLDVDGAGMHIAAMLDSTDGRYPVGTNWPAANIENFKDNVELLLPALFIGACSGNFTRPLGYRNPKIDFDKYSAIHITRAGAIEYRLFETCYQRPEAFFEYLGMIAKTLEYYKDPSKKVERQGEEFVFYDEQGVEGILATPDNIRNIKKQLKLIKPDGMTLKSLQENREIKLSVTEANKKYKKTVKRVKALFKDHVKHYENTLNRPLEPYESIDYERRELVNAWPEPGMSEKDKIAYIRGIQKPDEEQFIRRNIQPNSTRTAVITI